MRFLGGCLLRDCLGSAAGLAVLIALVFALPRLSAGCGDYVMSVRDHGPTPPRMPESEKTPNRKHEKQQIPCSGPTCSQNHHRIPQTSTTIPLERVEMGIVLVRPSGSPNHSSSLLDESISRPMHRPRSIFHPPRPKFDC